jgi:hypothetical protein
VEKKVNKMAKSAGKPIVITTKSTFKGPGWGKQKVEPYVPPTPNKTYDPRKGGSIGVN